MIRTLINSNVVFLLAKDTLSNIGEHSKETDIIEHFSKMVMLRN